MSQRILAVSILVCMLLAGRTARAANDYANHPLNTWIKQSPREGAPSPRFGWEGSGVYDPYSQKWVHWGGHDSNPQGFALFFWDLHTARWAQRFPNTSPEGVCCVDGANVFDLANRRLVRFPGASLNHGWQWSRAVHLKNSPVWLYDPEANTWTNMRPPPYKLPEKYSKEVLGSLNACGTYDPNHETALSFGGQSPGGGTNNLFAYDAYANHLERMSAADAPSPRDGSGFCYDAANDCAILFGSQYSEDPKTYIYRYSTSAWEALDLSPHPPTRKEGPYSTIPKMAFDSLHNICLCVVWLGENDHETWALDVAKLAWTKLNPTPEPDPSKSRTRNLSYDPTLNLFFLETWSVAGQPQIWTYRYANSPPNLHPQPPGNLLCTTQAGGKATLTWTAVSGAKQYAIYRAQAEHPWQTRFTKLATTDQPTYQDNGLNPRQVYFYTIRSLADGVESKNSIQARTQPRVPPAPTVSVLSSTQVQLTWPFNPTKDIAGYNVYRGLATVATSTTLTGSWAYNDPTYTQPVVDQIRDITAIQKRNGELLYAAPYIDITIDLSKKGPESADYPRAVYAYFIRAVNRMGIESGPSPYALTIPSEPKSVLLREQAGKAEIKWSPNPESNIAGYRVYRYAKQMELLTPNLLKEPAFTHNLQGHLARYSVVAVDSLGQEGEPSSPVWSGWSYKGFFEGEWHQ
jgi:fibronectin type 3 domain-containing protein